MHRRLSPWLLAWFVFAAGCTVVLDFDREGPSDGGMDAGAVDAGPAPHDSGPPDAGPSDAGADAATDAEPEAGPRDAGADGGLDASADAGPDAGPSCRETCAGCCDADGGCIVSTGFNRCGTGGSTCVTCSSDTADACRSDGTCGCGDEAACGAGQRCASGACVCDGVSCPGGCCEGTTCRDPFAVSCGIGGATCMDCGVRGDRCTAGTCACGERAACTGVLRCNGVECVCPPELISTVANVDLQGTTTPLTRYTGTPIQVLPGEMLTVGGDATVNTNCGGCVIQMAMGLSTPGYGREAISCTSAGVPGACTRRLRATGDHSFRAPETPGLYQVRFEISGFFDSQCDLVRGFFERTSAGHGQPVVVEIEVVEVAGRCDVLDGASVNLNGLGNEIRVTPGTIVNMEVDWDYVSSTSGGILSQIVFGVVGPDDFIQPLACPFSRTFPTVCSDFAGVGTTGSFVAPSTPGQYTIRWQNHAEFNCTDARDRFVTTSTPPRSRTIGVVLVEP